MGKLLSCEDVIQEFNLNHALTQFRRIDYGNNEMKEERFHWLAKRSEVVSSEEERIHLMNDAMTYFSIYCDVTPGQTFEATWADIGRKLVSEKFETFLHPPKKNKQGSPKADRTIAKKRRILFEEIKSYRLQAGEQRGRRPFEGWSDRRIWELFHYYDKDGLRQDRFIDVPKMKCSIRKLSETKTLPQEIQDWARYGDENTDAYHFNDYLKWARDFAEMALEWRNFQSKMDAQKNYAP